MTQAFTPGLNISELTRITKIRELPVRGEILVKPGDVVSNDSIIGRAFLPGDLHIVRLTEKMGIEPTEVIKGLKVSLSDHVETGQLLCEHRGLFGLFKSTFISSFSGTVEFITERTGHIGIRGPARELKLNAYIAGTIVEVEDEKTATVQTDCSFLQGIFGVGGERRGILKVLEFEVLRPIEEKDIPAHVEGCLIVTSSRPTIQAVRKASNLGARAFICGSIDDGVLAAYLGYDLGIALTGDEEIPMSIMLTEGFGNLTMSQETFELFKKLDGKIASMNGATQVRAGALRPEVIVPNFQNETSSNASTQVISMGGLELGSRIRLIRVPYFGEIATVVELPKEPTRIETGAFARVLRARLKSNEVVTVPRANVELMTVRF